MRLFLFAITALLSITVNAQRLDENSLSYCLERGRTALDIARSLAEGLPPDKINLAFFHAPKNDIDMAYREKWAEALKAEAAAAYAAVKEGPQRPERAAQKVAEACAYELGKQRRLKPTRVASSESIQNENQRKEICKEVLLDQIYIGRSVARKMPREELEARARANAHRLGEERMAKIMILIEEAYAAPNIQDWFDQHLADCMGRGS